MYVTHEVEIDSYEVLMLNKILHGQADSSRFWFDKINYRLEDQNFEPSDYVPCMFIYDKVIFLVYVHDCIWFTKYRKDIGELINYFQKEVLFQVPGGTYFHLEP